MSKWFVRHNEVILKLGLSSTLHFYPCHVISNDDPVVLSLPQREGEPDQQTLSAVCGSRTWDPLLCGEREAEWCCLQLLLCGLTLHYSYGGTHRSLVSCYLSLPHPHSWITLSMDTCFVFSLRNNPHRYLKTRKSAWIWKVLFFIRQQQTNVVRELLAFVFFIQVGNSVLH